MRIIKKSEKKIILPPVSSPESIQRTQVNIVKNNTEHNNTAQIKTVKQQFKKTKPATAIVKPKLELTSAPKKRITFACDQVLFEQVQTTLQQQHLAGDYSYPSVSEVIRQTLRAYQSGMKLTQPRVKENPKRDVAFRLADELLNFYNSLPSLAKTAVLERALASYYQQYLLKG